MKAYKINNTTIQLEFDSPEQRSSIAKYLSYDVPGAKHTAAFKSGRWNGQKSYLTPANRIKLGSFKALFPKHSLVYDKDFIDLGFDDIDLFNRLPNIEKRQYQLDAINAVFRNKVGLLQAVMGGGKTLVAAGVCSYHLSLDSRNKILFIVYDKNILHQTIANFTNYGFNVSQFGDGVKDLDGDVVVATLQSLNRIENPKEALKYVTFMIADESHHTGSKTSKDVISKLSNCQYFIGLTATPLTTRSIETADLTSVLGPVIFSYGFEKAVEDNKISPVKAFFLKVDPDWDLKEEIFERKNYKLIWDKAIRDNVHRNDILATILDTVTALLDTTNLVLVDRTEHGITLCESLKSKKNIRATTMYGSDGILMRNIKKAHLTDDTSSMNTLISTVCKEGTDFKISPVIAVNASGRRGFISLIQFLGRITRPNEKFKTFRAYIDIYDTTHPFLRFHSQERIKACKEFGVEVMVCNSMQELMREIINHYNMHVK